MIIQLHPESYANSQPTVDAKTLEGGTVSLCEMLAWNLGPDTILVRNWETGTKHALLLTTKYKFIGGKMHQVTTNQYIFMNL